MDQRIHTLSRALTTRLGAVRDERGSIMLEALASAVLLAIVTLAVLSAVDGASATSGRSKARTAAAALAEQDQERMRAMRFVDLASYNVSNPAVVDGVTYTVTSRADWIRDATGGTESCTNDSTQANYIRIRSTVTSKIVGTQTRPVVVDSLVTPNVGTFGPNQGTLAVKLVGRDNQPVTNVNVSISSPARSLSDVTNGAGCAIFAYIPQGDYDIALSQPGWVTEKAVNTGRVNAGQTDVVEVKYDRAATFTATFVTQAPGVPKRPSAGLVLSGANAARPGAPVITTALATPAKTITKDDLFPYVTGYGFYSGTCLGPDDDQSNDPTRANASFYPASSGFEALDPGQVAGEEVLQPGIRMRVVDGANPVDGATVYARSTSTQCVTPRHLLTTGPDPWGDAGFITHVLTPPYTPAQYDPGLPFGRYTICVQLSGPDRYKDVGVVNTSPAGRAESDLDVSSGTTPGTCP